MLIGATFHHVGIATNSIEETSIYYLRAGYEMSETIFDSKQNVYISFLMAPNSPRLELVAPVDDLSPVNNILKKVGVSAYHLCYEVDNIENSIIELKRKKFILVSRSVEAVAFNGRKVCFLYNTGTGLIELLEREPS